MNSNMKILNWTFGGIITPVFNLERNLQFQINININIDIYYYYYKKLIDCIALHITLHLTQTNNFA